ncbi:MAG: tyrosine-type recombinase/integrase [Ginsengibacter sp.]
MSVKLRKRKNSDGTTSLRLDIFHNGSRRIETLKHLQLSKPSTFLDRENNKRRLQQAEEIAIARSAELQANDYNMVSDAGKKTVITEWMQNYVDNYKKKDVRNMQGALNKFKTFLKEERKPQLTFGNLSPLIIEDFMEYLDSISTGEGAQSYYSRFKKMIKQAYRKSLLKSNPVDLVEKRLNGKAKKKDILTIPELKILASTTTESSEVKKAFLFSCVTGLRWIDIKSLKWSSINIANRQMNVNQAKTGEDVATPLNDTAIQLLGEPGNRVDYVFNLPSANGANKTVKAWVKRAGINKAITWHNARHSFGTNLIYSDVDVLTASKLLGHTSMKHTQRYVKASQEMKEAATDKLNFEL